MGGRGGATKASQMAGGPQSYTMGGRGGAKTYDEATGRQQGWGEWLTSKFKSGAQGSGAGQAGQLVRPAPGEPTFATTTRHPASVYENMGKGYGGGQTASPEPTPIIKVPPSPATVAPELVVRRKTAEPPTEKPRPTPFKPGEEGKPKPLIEKPEKRGTPRKDTAGKVTPNPRHRDEDTKQPVDQTNPAPWASRFRRSTRERRNVDLCRPKVWGASPNHIYARF